MKGRITSRWVVAIAACFAPLTVNAGELHVSIGGRDSNPGTATAPIQSVAAAQTLARRHSGVEPLEVLFHAGTYYLPETIHFAADDSGSAQSPVIYAAAPGERVVLSGGTKLDLAWKPYRDGILQAKTPPGLQIDQLF